MAARGVNKAIIVGNLGNDPDSRYMPNGNAVTNLSVATSESWTDKNTGQEQERTEWHRIVAYGKLAEIMAQYLRKGSKVYIEGRIQTRKWQDQSGQDRYTTEIVANEMQMLDSRQGGASDFGNSQSMGQQNNNFQTQQPSPNYGQSNGQSPQHNVAPGQTTNSQNATLPNPNNSTQNNPMQGNNINEFQKPQSIDDDTGFDEDIPF